MADTVHPHKQTYIWIYNLVKNLNFLFLTKFIN